MVGAIKIGTLWDTQPYEYVFVVFHMIGCPPINIHHLLRAGTVGQSHASLSSYRNITWSRHSIGKVKQINVHRLA